LLKRTTLIFSYCLFALIIPSLAFAAQKADSSTTQPTMISDDAINRLEQRVKELEAELQTLKKQQIAFKKQQSAVKKTQAKHQEFHKTTVRSVSHSPSYLLGSAVVTSPYVGTTSEFGGGDLIVNTSSINRDLALMQLRHGFVETFEEAGLTPPDHPVLELSGEVRGLAFYQNPYSGNTDSDVNIDTVEVDFFGLVNPWVLGFVSLEYDAAGPETGARVSNSNLSVDNAFFTIGNLDKFPVYLTMGQIFAPFGQYASSMITNPFTKTAFRTKTRAILLGYKQYPSGQGFNGSVYAFRGDTRKTNGSSGNNKDINNWGADLGFSHGWGLWKTRLAASYINNVADSQSMQDNGGSSTEFAGFSASSVTKALDHRVPGVDVRGRLGYDVWGLVTEYVAAIRRFAEEDMTYNGHGALPSALNVEGSYDFKLFGNHPSRVAAGYGASWEALGINIPKHRYIANFSTSWWKDTVFTLEFLHDDNYNRGDTAGGLAEDGTTALAPSVADGTVGRHSNTLLAAFDLYF